MNEPKRRSLDMNHGYIKYIQQVQVHRDEFNKCSQERAEKINRALKPLPEPETVRTQRSYQSRLYIPPALRKHLAAPTKDTETEASTSGKKQEEKSEPKIVITTSTQLSQKDEEKWRRQARNRFDRMNVEQNVDDICKQLEDQKLKDSKKSELLFSMILKNPQDESQDEICVDVTTADLPARIAKTLSRNHGFDDDLCRRLRLFIEEEVEKRTSSKEETN